MASLTTFELYRAIYTVRPRCPITGKIGNEIHHALIERGASGLPVRAQGVIHVPWNCVLLSTEGHVRLHNSDPKLNLLCIKSLIEYYGDSFLNEQIKQIPFTETTTLAQVLARQGYVM